jgi:hypothetical protein
MPFDGMNVKDTRILCAVGRKSEWESCMFVERAGLHLCYVHDGILREKVTLSP